MNLLFATFLAVLLVGFGCSKPVVVDSANWSKPQVVSQSSDSLSASFFLYNWNGSLVALGGDAGSFAIHFLREDGAGWRTIHTDNLGCIPMDCDPVTPKVVVTRGVLRPDKIEMSFAYFQLGLDGTLQNQTTNYLTFDCAKFFQTKNPNVRFPASKKLYAQPFAGGVIRGAEIYVPYSMYAVTLHGKGFSFGDGPAVCGVFTTRNSSASWVCETVAKEDWFIPSVHKTLAHLYFLGGDTKLQKLKFSRKTAASDSWEAPQIIENAQCPSGVNLYYQAVAVDECVHLVWLDRRHEKKRLNPVYPNRENYEVAYCYRKDSDATWSKDVILSDGLLYAYAPSISAEGDNVVVAWAGVQNDKDGRNEFNPSDIFYVTSRDGGKTWTKPIRVTDSFKDGFTSGRPRVALHKGGIHLFYIQGKLDYKKVSTGMVKLNQPPWPIYYQQRPFPN